MKVHLLSIALAATLMPLEATAAKADPMCAPLREFVASVRPGETKGFEFHTSWGGNFKDSTGTAISAKRCNPYGYGPAETVCAYLMQHGATEFSDNNLKRAVMCLSPKTRIDAGISLGNAVISLTYGSSERGSHVGLELADDPKVGGRVLKVAADGY